MAYRFRTTEARSRLMSKIRSNNTSPEVALRKKLWGKGFRFGKNVSRLIGKPDIVLNKYRVAVFVDGEFWHGYGWNNKKNKIKSNKSYWLPKIERNIKRDKVNTAVLRKMGWRTVRFWQHEVEQDIDACVAKINKIVQAYKLRLKDEDEKI